MAPRLATAARASAPSSVRFSSYFLENITPSRLGKRTVHPLSKPGPRRGRHLMTPVRRSRRAWRWPL